MQIWNSDITNCLLSFYNEEVILESSLALHLEYHLTIILLCRFTPVFPIRDAAALHQMTLSAIEVIKISRGQFRTGELQRNVMNVHNVYRAASLLLYVFWQAHDSVEQDISFDVLDFNLLAAESILEGIGSTAGVAQTLLQELRNFKIFVFEELLKIQYHGGSTTQQDDDDNDSSKDSKHRNWASRILGPM